MERLIEVLRRLAIVIVWLFGLGITAIFFIGAQENGALAGLGLGALVLTWLVVLHSMKESLYWVLPSSSPLVHSQGTAWYPFPGSIFWRN